ncbi:MAG: pyruvate ferredoxin oxidoreductase [Thermoproteota archaeon]|nr:MAG: pyruvate ferredoxin oxidoreductase [Candidatus Korarchaeota archaeon]
MTERWVPNLKQLAKKPELLSPGHRLCAGCAAGTIIRQVLKAVDDPVVIVNATGCLEVATTIFPYTAWRVPWIHNAFENAAATAAGIVAARDKMHHEGRIKQKYRVLVIGGDGSTYDIGLQAISGAFERGEDITYLLYDNEAYMNTGIQRSGGTPHGAWTTTTPAGKVIPGKELYKKPILDIFVAHGIPYAATATPSRPIDLMKKARKAFHKTPSFLHTLTPCNRGWRFPTNLTIKIAQLAVETCIFPLVEYEDGQWRLTDTSLTIAKNPQKKKPIEEYLKLQGRFKHLFTPENRHVIKEIQEDVDRRWQQILERTGLKP